MEGVAVGLLRDLFAAAETVGYDQPVGGSLADGGEEFEFSDGFGDVVFIFFEAEGSGHAAAAGGGRGVVDAHAMEDGFFGGHSHDGFMVAVAVDESAAGEFRERKIFRALIEKLAEQEDLVRERVGALAAFGIQHHLYPQKRQFLQYTTTSPIMQKRLGVTGESPAQGSH